MQAIARDTKQIWIERFDAFLSFCFRVVSRGMDRELARRAVERGHGEFRWITSEEAKVAEALANLIVPSDGETPGIEDVCILGPSTLKSLDRLIASSLDRQRLYGQGLLAFDVWAQRQHGCLFTSMPQDDQIRLLRASQRSYEEWTSPAPLAQKAWRRFTIAIRGKGAPFSAGQLYPQIRSDCLQVFYTSRVSWIWLGYDGPPMDEGYPKLAPRHAPQAMESR